VFGKDAKRRRLEEQRKGEFIVDALKAVNFRLTSNMAALEDEQFTSSFFSPIYMGTVSSLQNFDSYSFLERTTGLKAMRG
jgi:hypothetical protein